MRRIALVGAGLVLPFLPAAPAFAADNIICVTGVVAGTSCDQTFTTIPDALAEASGNGLPDTILLGPVSYPSGPLNLNGNGQLTLQGSGPATILTMSGTVNPDTFLSVTNGATVRDLTVKMPAASSTGDIGILASGSTVQNVSVDGTGTSGTTGLKVQGSTIVGTSVHLPLASSNTRALYSTGGNNVTNIDLQGDQGYAFSASDADNVSRARIVTDSTGVSLDSGTITLDDALIVLESGATGLDAANYNNAPGSKTINANHVTVVGPGSQGAHAFVGNGNASQQATINLTNSIVAGPAMSLHAEADTSTGSGVPSHATINVSYSDWQTGPMSSNDPSGIGLVNPVVGNFSNDPEFVNPGSDYHLAPGSVLIDLGDPAAGPPAVDLDGNARVTDGDGDGTARRDMGAYESAAVPSPPTPPTPGTVDTAAPQTTITARPHKRLTRPRARFAFTSSEVGAGFACKLDRRPWRACTSPARFRVKVGRHHFWVRATDLAGNIDQTPAAYRFRRVR